MNCTRRGLLKACGGALATSVLAGCLDGTTPGTDNPRSSDGLAATASFFTLHDFANHVGGDTFPVENAVPVGQHGHGWEPRGDIMTDIVRRDAFIYVALDGFQRWADETSHELETNYPDVTLINAVDGVELHEYNEHESHNDDGDSHDDHDDRNYDPHFWVDPVKAAASVDAILDGILEVDPDNAGVYESNAASYKDELATLDQEFEDALAEREHDVAVLAGHDSYQYLARRYGFDIHSPVGVAPQSEPSTREIADTIEFVNEHGIDYILRDAFESPDLAQTIVAESDAEGVETLSPVESVTEAWNEKNWGYVEQMREINLPAVKRALGAE